MDSEGRSYLVKLAVLFHSLQHIGHKCVSVINIVLIHELVKVSEKSLGSVAVVGHSAADKEDIGNIARKYLVIELCERCCIVGSVVGLTVAGSVDSVILVCLVELSYLGADIPVDVEAAQSKNLLFLDLGGVDGSDEAQSGACSHSAVVI